MLKRLQHRAADGTQPIWQRLLVFGCLLLVVFASSAQAIHTHGKFLPQHESQLQSAPDLSQPQGGEEHCPLCIAMHSAMVSTPSLSVAEIALVTIAPRAEFTSRAQESPWHHAGFSRPPPAVETL